MSSNTYLGNPNLKNIGQPIEWTEENIGEYFIDHQTGEFFLIDTLENGEIGKIRKG